ncbi:Beta-amylase 1 [Forsythia ovata]|uniref:Beta-amylase n=1 Tax=Forsythia ovata TaxID=205694 RepID=A0ABD1WN20_9LAMI
MAIESFSAPSFSSRSVCSNTRTESTQYTRSHSFPHVSRRTQLTRSTRYLKFQSIPTRGPAIISRLNASSDGELMYELHCSYPRRKGRTPVYVTLPVDSVGPSAQTMRRKKVMAQSFRALAAAGVEGVVMEVWWGLVEREYPRLYNWQGYLEIILLAKRCGLKVRAVMAFHQCGSGPGDPFWIPLPQWVLEEMDRDPNLSYSDRFGRRNMEYISLGCDNLPILHGRSPIQAYADFIRNFRDTFRPFLGSIVTGIQVGLGPGGELRYPSCPTQKLTWAWQSLELGEFQCYDKYMLASLNAHAWKRGMHEWANAGPIGASNLLQNLENTDFFRTDGSWKTPYGEFFLEWYSGMLLLHGERICKEVKAILRGTEVNMSGKVGGMYWHYGTQSHPSELTAGYYNTSTRDGFLPIARMFGRYGFSICCACFEMQDSEGQQMNATSSPEGFLEQLLLAARDCDIPLEGENSATNFDDTLFQQVLKTSKFYSDGPRTPPFSFNFVRMDKNLFEYRNWSSFTRFVRQMSDVNSFRGKLGFGGDTTVSSPSAAAYAGAVLA